MTEPMIVKAMDHLDDDLIAAAAERKAAPRLMTKRKFVALLAACLLLVGTLAMMGMEEKTVGPTKEDREAAWLAYMDYSIETYKAKEDYEMVAYFEKWRDVGFEALNPWPDEWENPDGSFKDYVTIAMVEEAYEGSLLQEYDFSNPEVLRGSNPRVEFFFADDRKVLNYAISFMP